MRLDHLGPSGHARLGWAMRRGDLQGPVGYDEHSLGYRDLEGCKVHRALREPYGAPYGQVSAACLGAGCPAPHPLPCTMLRAVGILLLCDAMSMGFFLISDQHAAALNCRTQRLVDAQRCS